MSLPLFWFAAIAVLWTGFFVLEGFDFGVGMLHRFLGRTDLERRVYINSIGPFWDGNEVWLIVGGAAIFAAFPGWYATWFSAGYLALVVVLLALMARGVSFEYRGRRDTARWREGWSWSLVAGSALLPLLLGVALGDLLAGLPVDSSQEFTGNFWDLLTPYGLFLGVTLLVLCIVHGATFLTLRTFDGLRDRAHGVARVMSWPALVLVLGYAVWTLSLSSAGFWWGTLPLLVAVASAALAVWFAQGGREGAAFAATAVTIGVTVLSLFTNLYPDVLVSSTSSAYDLTVAGTASSHYALQVMTIVALVFVPLVLLYQGWTFVVFRRRIGLPPGSVDVPHSTDQGAPV
ncbi:MAG TPA: cytochrome d ubiquinol oxidase subunit II [Actinomycetes bacterium]|nr:cytochrome d ubiquinol oxidase subunit II [Actinomycetes bacterium]